MWIFRFQLSFLTQFFSVFFPLGKKSKWFFNNEIVPFISVRYYVVERGLIASVPKVKVFEVFYDVWPIISFRSAYRSRTFVDFSMQCYFWQSWAIHSQSMSKVTKPWKSDHCLNACEIRVFSLIFWDWPDEIFIGAKFDRLEELNGWSLPWVA